MEELTQADTSRPIEECLGKKKLNELIDLGFRLLVQPPERRRDRKAWIERIAAALRDDPAPLRMSFDVYALDALVRLLDEREEGKPIFVSRHEAYADSDLQEACERLAAYGLAWRERSRWQLQPQVWQLTRIEEKDSELLLSLQSLYEIVNGWLMLYGVLELETLIEKIGLSGEEHADERDLMLAMWRSREGLKGFRIEEETFWLVCP